MKRRLSNSEVKELAQVLGETGISKKDIVESGIVQGVEVLFVNGSPSYFKADGKWLPTLRRVYAGPQHIITKSVTVDAGAIKFISNGADVMRPGITAFDEGIEKNDFLLVKEITHGKVLAIGKALASGTELKSASKGKVISNVHYVGDWLWNLQP